jgi:hypothetical protein
VNDHDEPKSFSERFLAFDYAELKDLSKAFLTLATTILAFSVTFSEKIVNFQSASIVAKFVLLVSWAFFVLSVILCGFALCLGFASAAKATHGENYVPFLERYGWFGIATLAGFILFFAGLAFVCGLLALIASAAIPLLS